MVSMELGISGASGAFRWSSSVCGLETAIPLRIYKESESAS